MLLVVKSSRPFISRSAAHAVLACAICGLITLFSYASSFYLIPVARIGLGLDAPTFSEARVLTLSRNVMACAALQTLLYLLFPLFLTKDTFYFVDPFLLLPFVGTLCVLAMAFRLRKSPPSTVDVRVLTRHAVWCTAVELVALLYHLVLGFRLLGGEAPTLFTLFLLLHLLSALASIANAVAACISGRAWRRFQGALLSQDESSHLAELRIAELALAGPGAPAGGFAARGGEEEGAPLFAAM